MKQRERVLLYLFLTILLGVTIFIGLGVYRKVQLSLSDKVLEAQLVNDRYSTLLSKEKLWKRRESWLDANQPNLRAQDTASESLFRVASSPPNGVELIGTQLLETVEYPHFLEVGVSLSVAGELSDIMVWLNGLQAPGSFYVARSIDITPHDEFDKGIVCEIVLCRWYQR